ncbi:hypothetical protein MNBD_PLANCTO02-366 [hydrothermal vent metagenome]|uniref:Prenyltransferase n=1 Tax=hydrothermal vent metagenome TaxID=652676 RepID=A0A3B1DW83_9ZZZZ
MQTLRDYLKLLRFPAVFTALADIFLGHLLLARNLQPIGAFCLLLVSSASLYLAGMVFNDIFDRKIDAQERSFRPIPSGAVSLKSAIVLGMVLLVMGVTSAFFVSLQSLSIALMLTVAILAYDGFLKKTFLGPVAMGSCRFLNIMLGATAVEQLGESLWGAPQLYVAGGLAVYIAGVTWFARNEASEKISRWQLIGAAGIVNCGLLVMFGLIFSVPDFLAYAWHGKTSPLHVGLLLAAISFSLNRRMFVALKNPSPSTIQPAVKTMLLSVIMLDATLILLQTGLQPFPIYSVMVAALLLPALFLGRFIYMT